MSPINLLSEDVQIKQEFFQSLFIKIKEDKSLLNLKTKIDNQFTMPDKIFFPHISLYYGDKDKEKKTKAIKQLDKFNNTFLLEKLCLVEVDEEISSWRIIETYSLLWTICNSRVGDLTGDNYGRISRNRICFWNGRGSSTSSARKTYKNLKRERDSGRWLQGRVIRY